MKFHGDRALVAPVALLAGVLSLVFLTSHSALAHDSGSTERGARVAGLTQFEGTLEILHEDRLDGTGHYRHFLTTDDGQHLILHGVPHHHDLQTGDRVRLRASRAGKTLQLDPSAAGLQLLATASAFTLGPQKTLV